MFSAVSASAQTTTNPARVIFTASSDHAKQLQDGTPAVSSYELDCMVGTVTGAVAFTKGLGKPTPAPTTNDIGPINVPEFITQPFGTFVCTVGAVGPTGGKAFSTPTPFNSVPPAGPNAPGAPRYCAAAGACS
jgi:hypothetical protein